MRKSEVIEILSKELDWCNKNPMPQFSDEYRNGFRNGLIQARFLVSQMGRGLTPVAADGATLCHCEKPRFAVSNPATCVVCGKPRHR